MRTTPFQSLIVRQKQHQLVLDIYRSTKSYPEDDFLDLVSQMRGATISITANIAERYRKMRKKDKLCFKPKLLNLLPLFFLSIWNSLQPAFLLHH